MARKLSYQGNQVDVELHLAKHYFSLIIGHVAIRLGVDSKCLLEVRDVSILTGSLEQSQSLIGSLVSDMVEIEFSTFLAILGFVT